MQAANDPGRQSVNVIPLLAAARFPSLMVTHRLFALCRGGKTRADQMLAILIDDLEAAGALTPAHTTALLMCGSGAGVPATDTPLRRLWDGAISTLTAALQDHPRA